MSDPDPGVTLRNRYYDGAIRGPWPRRHHAHAPQRPAHAAPGRVARVTLFVASSDSGAAAARFAATIRVLTFQTAGVLVSHNVTSATNFIPPA